MPEQTVANSCAVFADGAVPQPHNPLIFYPAYCYEESPTWFTWVKLTAYDVHHRLHARHDYQPAPSLVNAHNGWRHSSTHLLFYLNHPIQFVQLVGVVVSFEDHFEKFWLCTIDDGSGATIEVICWKAAKNADDEGPEKPKAKKDLEQVARCNIMSNLDVGAVIQVKGQVTVFRDMRQLQLDRVVVLRETNQEVRLIAARADYHRRVLSMPWHLSDQKRKKLQQEVEGSSASHSARMQIYQRQQQRRRDREKRHAQKIAKQYGREERQRQGAAEEARKAGRLLRNESRRAVVVTKESPRH